MYTLVSLDDADLRVRFVPGKKPIEGVEYGSLIFDKADILKGRDSMVLTAPLSVLREIESALRTRELMPSERKDENAS